MHVQSIASHLFQFAPPAPQQKVDKCTALRFDANPKSSLYALVVSNYQPRQRLRWFPSPVGPNWHFHAWQNPNIEDLIDSNFPRTFVAEDTREYCYGYSSGV